MAAAFTVPSLNRPSLVSKTKRLYESSFVEAALGILEPASCLRGKIIVVKYGGNAMTSPELAFGFCQDVAALQHLGITFVAVHGTYKQGTFPSFVCLVPKSVQASHELYFPIFVPQAYY